MKQKFSEIAALSAEELKNRLKAAKEELFTLRFQLATRQLENTARISEVKTTIAQIQTALRSKELATAGGK